MLGKDIILATQRRGVTIEGIIDGTPKPGQIMQIKLDTAKVGGRFTWQVYTPGGNAQRPVGPLAVLDMDDLQGRMRMTPT